MTTATEARRAFERKSIPEGYCKVIHIGEDGETGLVEVMPERIACQQFGLEATQENARSVIVVHPMGCTRITWTEYSATSEAFLDEAVPCGCGACTAAADERQAR